MTRLSQKMARGEGFSLLELLVVVAVLASLAALVISTLAGTARSAETTVTTATLRAVRDGFLGDATAPGYLADLKQVPGFAFAAVRVGDLLAPWSYPDFAAYDPDTKRGWNGPYLGNVRPPDNTNDAQRGRFPLATDRRSLGDRTFRERGFYYDAVHSYYGATNELAAADPWGNPVVLQVPPSEAFAGSTGEVKRFRYARVVSAGPDGALDTPRDRLAGLLADGTHAARGDDLVLFLNRADVCEHEEP